MFAIEIISFVLTQVKTDITVASYGVYVNYTIIYSLLIGSVRQIWLNTKNIAVNGSLFNKVIPDLEEDIEGLTKEVKRLDLKFQNEAKQIRKEMSELK